MGTTIESGGGAVIEGDVSTRGGDFIGRDQNNLYFLDPINDAARLGEILAALSEDTDIQKDREIANVVADLNDLMQELSETHKTIVKMVSPLRRTSDDPSVFTAEFPSVYYDFQDSYDAHDFLNERTHCHKIGRIHGRLLRRRRLFGTEEQWQDLDHLLSVLDNADLDIIEKQYVPFMVQLNDIMNRIKELVDAGSAAEAVAEKRRFLDALEPEYTRNKAMLKEMIDTIGKLTRLMESSQVT